mmetsp:Transcript_892/g.1605  ORF Transcript_892/g.1605 Transcript_892/m.1605 type:complete len:113 (-) Transcript_892:27-365(-)
MRLFPTGTVKTSPCLLKASAITPSGPWTNFTRPPMPGTTYPQSISGGSFRFFFFPSFSSVNDTDEAYLGLPDKKKEQTNDAATKTPKTRYNNMLEENKDDEVEDMLTPSDSL